MSSPSTSPIGSVALNEEDETERPASKHGHLRRTSFALDSISFENPKKPVISLARLSHIFSRRYLHRSHYRRRQASSDLEMHVLDSSDSLDIQRAQLMAVLFSTGWTGMEHWPGAMAYLAYVEEQLKVMEQTYFKPLWRFLNIKEPIGMEELLRFLTRVALIFRQYETNDASINEIVKLTLGQMFRTIDDDLKAIWCQAVFLTLSWLTMIAQPERKHSTHDFHITLPICSRGIHNSQTFKNAQRPINSMFRAFGHLLPDINSINLPGNADQSATSFLYVASLNFSSLKTIGRIQIEWTSILSAHLEFQPSTRTLMLFRFPTFCALNILAEDNRSVFDSILFNYYPCIETVSPLLASYKREVLLSYRLLFGQTRSARAHFQASESKILSRNKQQYDDLLFTLCSQKSGEKLRSLPSTLWPPSCRDFNNHLQEQDAYSIHSDFPVLGARLLKIQAFNLRQQPSRIRDLWRDRRNPLQWYTFWAVLWIGGLSLLLTLVGLLIAGGQLAVAIKVPSC